MAASWALVFVVLVRDARAVDEQPRVLNARKPTEHGEQLLLLLCPPMELAAAAVSLCGVRGCICGRRVVELVLTAGPARAFRCPAAADLTVRNGVGVAAEAVHHPLDRRSSLRTRTATCRPLACVAWETEPFILHCAGPLARAVHLTSCTERAAVAIPTSASLSVRHCRSEKDTVPDKWRCSPPRIIFQNKINYLSRFINAASFLVRRTAHHRNNN